MSFTPLPDNGTIAVIAPSSRIDVSKIMPAVDILEARGFKVSLHPQIHLTHHQSAGTAQERANAIMDVFLDDSVDAIICATGGNRSMHTFPFLNFEKIKNNPKPFLGFSDSTALINALYAQCGLVGFHGPYMMRIPKTSDDELNQMLDALQGKKTRVSCHDAVILNDGQATGPMIGGNLSLVTPLCGTPYMPETKGAILFLEDIGDQLSRYDRMLMQLRLAGVFDNIAGLVFGVMHAEGDSSVTPFGFTLSDIIAEHTCGLNIPIMVDAPFGHKGPLWTLPVGKNATFDTNAKTITF